MLLEEGNTSSAERVLKDILESDPWNMEARMIFADMAFTSQQYQRAADFYRQILELNPCLPKPYLRLHQTRT